MYQFSGTQPLHGVTDGCSVQTAVPSLQDVQMLALRSCQYLILSPTAGSLVLSLAVYLTYECILFTDINQRRNKIKTTEQKGLDAI
jgi:hypothetical protein